MIITGAGGVDASEDVAYWEEIVKYGMGKDPCLFDNARLLGAQAGLYIISVCPSML